MYEDEFDVYFQRAKEETEQLQHQQLDDSDTRRGSVPNIQVHLDSIYHHKRALSCKTPSRRGIRTSASPCGRARSPRHSVEETIPENASLVPPDDDSSRKSAFGEGNIGRSGSFRHKANPRPCDRDGQVSMARSGSLILDQDDNITSKLEQLQMIEKENLCVVRTFATSPRGIVSRGDSVKRKRRTRATTKQLDNVLSIPETTSQKKTSSDHNINLESNMISKDDQESSIPAKSPNKVLIIGEHAVGKTALLHQFMTSEYMGDVGTNLGYSQTNQMAISVELDGDETMMDIIDVQVGQDITLFGPVEALILVYAIDEDRSFRFVTDFLHDLRREDMHRGAVIVVANKGDLVRSRAVTEDEALEICTKYECKYIEVSAAMNHQVDDLLVGVVSQIRLNQYRKERRPKLSKVMTCVLTAKSFIDRVLNKPKEINQDCDNLHVL